MSNQPPRRITYLGYYDTVENAAENRAFVLPAVHKMNYIMSALERLGYSVDVVSASHTLNARGYHGHRTSLSGNRTLTQLRTLPWGNKARRVASILTMRTFVLLWLLLKVKTGENLIVYHSLGYANEVLLARKLRRFRLVLEVEEIYADVTGRAKDRAKEDRVFSAADAFIFSTKLLSEKVSANSRPSAIVHGVYTVQPLLPVDRHDGRTHVLYAGTLDPRKGATTAVLAARFLDSSYHLHVIGFGSAPDRERLLSLIREVEPTSECRVDFDGLLAGTQYLEYVQKCSIGLCTQGQSEKFNETSFPSKVLSYMSNGLHVVSVRIRAIEESGVGDLITFYDGDDPEAVARAIREASGSKRGETRLRLEKLDVEFREALRGVLAQ